MAEEYTVIIEQDEEGYYVAEVAELPGCHTQARDVDTLMARVREAVELWLDGIGAERSFNTPITFTIP